MIQIDKGIPIPTGAGTGGRACLYPYKAMEVGDSFYVEGENKIDSIRNQASNHWSKKTGFKFSVRSEPGGCRVWRTA